MACPGLDRFKPLHPIDNTHTHTCMMQKLLQRLLISTQVSYPSW